MTWHLDVLGDSAVRARHSASSAHVANAQAHRLAAALRDAALPGVRDIVPGVRDVVVHIDPLRCDLARIEALLSSLPDEPTANDADHGAIVDVPVTYGGVHGPDLEAVAQACGLSADEVCRRHAATVYRVCFVGFLPGFPYLGWLDPAIQLPRRETPRPVVPAGSVAIAGEYAGIYPSASPGGWHLIGHTDVELFDVTASPPARLTPGTRVRFVPR